MVYCQYRYFSGFNNKSILFISYATLAWGSTYNSHLKKVQIKQNHVAGLIFFATTYGKDVKSAHLMLNLLDILTVYMFIAFLL